MSRQLRIVLHWEAACRRCWRDRSIVRSAHICRARVGGFEIEVVRLAIVAQGWDAVVDEVGIGEHGQIVLDQVGLDGRKLRIFEADLVEVVDVILQIWPVSASVARHGERRAGTLNSASVSVVGEACATDGQVGVDDADDRVEVWDEDEVSSRGRER